MNTALIIFWLSAVAIAAIAIGVIFNLIKDSLDNSDK
jgi:hypothetical protein